MRDMVAHCARRGVTSAQLVQVLSVETLTSVTFSDPREALLTLLPRCTALTKLALTDFTTITEPGWQALAACMGSVRVLKLIDVPYVTDAQMALVLQRALRLEKLEMRNLVAVQGECLRVANLSSMRALRQGAVFSPRPPLCA